jgi:hypothetical protein
MLKRIGVVGLAMAVAVAFAPAAGAQT